MARVYLSGRLRLRHQLREDREVLEAAGHTSTARWLDDVGGTPEEIAQRDLEDIDRATVVIVRGHCGRNGGLMFEVGYALAQGKRILHVSAEREPREAFLFAEGVEHFRHMSEAIEALGTRRKVAA
jgi:nucleoside 2-deoxyribosyltransferase